jgi:predicted DNA repair protein MutK
VRPARELPVVWAVARGSAFNKLVLVPAALAISWLAPGAVTPLLMIGGGYLCYEGMEKILHGLLHRDGHHAAGVASVEPPVEEADKIAGAIRTDFILSAEIIVIALGVVAGRPLPIQLAVLVAISAAMTRAVGRGILAAAPWLMRGLSVAGTAAMFLVGGGIIAHGIPALHHAVHGSVAEWLGDAQGGATARTVLTMALDAGVGMAVGLALVAALSLGTRLASHVRGLRTHG